MTIKIYSANANYGNGKFKKYYIEKLKKYKLREIIYEDRGSVNYYYYIKINDLSDIFNIIEELGQELIIDKDSITIYDDYIE